MSHIICVGVATLDVILNIERFPREDEEMRAQSQRLARGGNAANSSVVLAQRGHRCDFVGALADDSNARIIENDLLEQGVSTRYCQHVEGAHSPTSYILVSRASGSRTIVHHRQLPEYDDSHFVGVDLEGCDWLHFEGRNVPATRRMLEHVRRYAPERPISVEIEKEREGVEALWSLAGILIFSRAFALGRGYADPEHLLDDLRTRIRDATLVCTWGEAGALAMDPGGTLHRSPAFPPATVLDTVGAGDTFNAGFIDALIRGSELEEALIAGCRLAGRKVGQVGFSGLCEP